LKNYILFMEDSSRKTFYSSSCKNEEDSPLHRQAQNGRFKLSCRKFAHSLPKGRSEKIELSIAISKKSRLIAHAFDNVLRARFRQGLN
jgi:hypothetical protein